MTSPRGDYQLSQLDVLEAESIHIMREVAAEFERPVLLFSGGKDSIVMLALAERAFWPAQIPFPVMHVDTGHNFPEVIDYPRPPGGRARRPADRRVGAGLHRRRQGGRGDRPVREPQPAADHHAAGRDRGATGSTPSSAAPAGTRKRRGPRSGCSRSGTSSASGTRRTSARSCGTSTTPGSAGRAHPGVPAVELDRAGRLAVHRAGAAGDPVDLLRPQRARCSSATASCWPTASS